MLKKCKYIPILETDRLVLRELTEAMKRVVEFIFSETALDRLEGRADVRNIGSNRVLQKSGFQREGTIRHGKMASQYCDYNIWGMIREDFTVKN